jgi:hypothetical protein
MAIVPDDELRPAILCLLQSGSGAACDFGLMIRVCRLESGRYWVTSDSPDGESLWGCEYDSAEEAVEVFLNLRHVRRLGHDYGPWPLT